MFIYKIRYYNVCAFREEKKGAYYHKLIKKNYHSIVDFYFSNPH